MRIPKILAPPIPYLENADPAAASCNFLWELLQTHTASSHKQTCHASILDDQLSADPLAGAYYNLTLSITTNNSDCITHSFHLRDLLVQVPYRRNHNDTHRLQLSLQEQLLLQVAESYQHPQHDNYAPSSTSSDHRPFSLAAAMAMKTLFRIAQLTDASSFIPISRAHIDACTYIGPGGLQFAQTLANLGGRVLVPSTTNASSVDRIRWRQLGTPSSKTVGLAACKVQDAYIQLGCIPSFSCAPYLPTNQGAVNQLPPPHFGEQLAWGESNAVVFANSVLGARTEKYADYMDICAALVGRVPLQGVHTDENRLPQVIIDLSDIIQHDILPLLDTDIQSNNAVHVKLKLGLDALYPVLGWLCGNLARDRIPLVLGMEQLLIQQDDDPCSMSWEDSANSWISHDDLKAFSAAFGTTATVPIFHIARITPEARDTNKIQLMIDHIARVRGNDPKTITVSSKQLRDAFRSLNHDTESHSEFDITVESEQIDLVALGNPHFSLSELRTFVQLLSAEDTSPKRSNVPVTITLSRDVYNQGKQIGFVPYLEAAGVQFISDTCWCMLLTGSVLPTRLGGIILTNSGKYASYGPGLTNRQLRFGSLRACASVMSQGKYPKCFRPAWVPIAAKFCTWASMFV